MPEAPVPMPACDHGCEKRSARLHFTIAGNVNAINPAVDQVTALARQQWGPDSEKVMDLGLAVQEALANAIVHGCKSDPAKQVEVWVACDGEGALVVVRDPGPGFDLARLPDPKHPRHLKKAHGRGIYLICELVDEVHFQRKGAEIHIKKA